MLDLHQRIDEATAVASDHHEFRRHADLVLREVLAYDISSWASLDPTTLLFTSCDVLGAHGPLPHDSQRERRLFEIEFAGTDPYTYAEMARRRRNVVRLRHHVAEVERVRRYTELIRPLGLFDEMRVLVADRTGIWGSVTMYRREPPGFDEEDERLASSLSERLGAAFRHAFLVAASERPSSLDRPPGTLTLDPNGDVIDTSEPAERWMDTLSGDQRRATMTSLWARTRRVPLARATIPGTEGPVTFHAFGRKGSREETAIVVEQPRPAELAELLISLYALTPREQVITRMLMHGYTTRVIAHSLTISEYTVQDHIRSIFTKFDVASRGELLAAVHSRHYLPAVEEDTTPGPYGWFLIDRQETED